MNRELNQVISRGPLQVLSLASRRLSLINLFPLTDRDHTSFPCCFELLMLIAFFLRNSLGIRFLNSFILTMCSRICSFTYTVIKVLNSFLSFQPPSLLEDCYFKMQNSPGVFALCSNILASLLQEIP